MMNKLTEESLKYIISRILDNANDTLQESLNNKDDEFYQGKKLAYYEMLDVLKNDLDIREQDLKEFGLDIDLDKMFI